MSVTQSMKHIDRTVEQVLGTHEQYETKKEGRSRRRSYEKSIEAVRDVAGTTEAKQLAQWIENRIRDDKELPSGRQVPKKGAEICRNAGHTVSTNDWLGA
jgi:hypothetical protein